MQLLSWNCTEQNSNNGIWLGIDYALALLETGLSSMILASKISAPEPWHIFFSPETALIMFFIWKLLSCIQCDIKGSWNHQVWKCFTVSVNYTVQYFSFFFPYFPVLLQYYSTTYLPAYWIKEDFCLLNMVAWLTVMVSIGYFFPLHKQQCIFLPTRYATPWLLSSRIKKLHRYSIWSFRNFDF